MKLSCRLIYPDPDYHSDLMHQIIQSDILDPSDNLFPWSMIPRLSLSPFSGGFSDSDLFDVGKDKTYKPDSGKGTWYILIKMKNVQRPEPCHCRRDQAAFCFPAGGRPSGDTDQIDQYDDNGGGFSLPSVRVAFVRWLPKFTVCVRFQGQQLRSAPSRGLLAP